jgi:endoglucanase
MEKMLAIIIVSLTSAWASAGEPNAFAMNKLIGRGINIGGALDTPKTEGEWGVTLQDEYFQIIKDAGFNSIRLPVRWNAHAANEPPYTIDPNFFKRVDWAINNCLSRNLPVVLFTHHYEELYGDPNGQKDRFLAIWKQIAEHYKDYPDALIFEPLSERVDKLNAVNWNSLTKGALTIIRRSNPHRTVVIGPGGFYLIDNKDDSNIIVDVHYFMPSEFTHQGATWVQDSEKWLGTKWTGSEKEKQAIINNFDIAADWSKKNNRPIYLSEFGVYEKADMDSRVRWTKCVVDAATSRGFSISYWEFCSVFGLYDLNTNSFRKPLLEAVIPPKKR